MKRSPSAERHVLVVALTAICVLVSACVHQGGPRLGIAKLDASLVFGLKPKAALPAVVPAGPLPPAAQTGAFDLVNTGNDVGDLPHFEKPKPTCPLASVTAAPERVTEVNINGQPLIGFMKFKRSGSFTSSGVEVPFGGYEGRIVRNFTQVDANTSTFEVIQPRVDAPADDPQDVKSTYQVKTDGTPTSAGGTNGVPVVQVDKPDAGVVLKKVEIFSLHGERRSLFEPSGGLLMLPLPVTEAHTWKSVAVDPKDGRSIELDGQITRRQRIDACGDLVDGWGVQTQYTDSAVGQTVSYDYIVATQYGGMLVSETLQPARPASAGGQTAPPPPSAQPFTADLNFQLAQVKPEPVPSNIPF